MLAEILIFSLALLAIFSIPILTGSFARRMGRRFWLWFFLAMVLPLIATLLLSILPDLSETNESKH